MARPGVNPRGQMKVFHCFVSFKCSLSRGLIADLEHGSHFDFNRHSRDSHFVQNTTQVASSSCLISCCLILSVCFHYRTSRTYFIISTKQWGPWHTSPSPRWSTRHRSSLAEYSAGSLAPVSFLSIAVHDMMLMLCTVRSLLPLESIPGMISLVAGMSLPCLNCRCYEVQF